VHELRSRWSPDSQERGAFARGLCTVLALKMAFTAFNRERRVRRVLRSLAGQRVVSVLQPGNVWLIENAPELPGQEEAVSTCLMRGWVEVLHNAVPKGQLGPDGLPDRNEPFKGRGTIYRITDSGWAVINRTHTWVMATFAVSLFALVAVVLQMWK
jgi:hypothetical protein